MTNFVLRLLKRRGVDKSKRRAHKEDDSSESEDDDDEGVVESKFDYDEGVMASSQNIQADVDVCTTFLVIIFIIIIIIQYIYNSKTLAFCYFLKCTGCASKKTIPLMFDNNYGKCGPIFKILSPIDS